MAAKTTTERDDDDAPRPSVVVRRVHLWRWLLASGDEASIGPRMPARLQALWGLAVLLSLLVIAWGIWTVAEHARHIRIHLDAR